MFLTEQTRCRRPLWGYRLAVYSIAIITLAGLLLFSFSVINSNLNVESLTLADIVPTPPGPDVVVLGPSVRSHLGGSGISNDFSDANRSQALVVGDFNADGIQDVAIGAPDADLFGSTFRQAAGSVYVILGRQNLPTVIDIAVSGPTGASVTIMGAAKGDHLGFALAAGDINGDGRTDLIVSAPGFDGPAGPDTGAVFTMLGSPAFGSISILDLGQSNTADVVIYGGASPERFGLSLATGDVGGPTAHIAAIADILVGAPGVSPQSAGAAYLIFGRTQFGNSTRFVDLGDGQADFTVRGKERQRLGTSVGVGDLNGDKAGDLFVGAPGADRPARTDLGGPAIIPAGSTGAVFGVLGPITADSVVSTEANQQSFSFYGVTSGDRLGASLAVGEVTGDSSDDLIVGAPGVAGEWTDPDTGTIYHLNANSGAVYVLNGKSSIPHRVDTLVAEHTTTSLGAGRFWYGFSVAIGSYNVPGNADITNDLLVGIPGAGRDGKTGNIGFGGAEVLFGGRKLLSIKTRPRSPSNPAPDLEDILIIGKPSSSGDNFGFSIAAGDINGDGAGDLIVAAPFADADGRDQAGQVQIRFGTVTPSSGCGGDPTHPRVTVDLLTPDGGEQLQAGRQVMISWTATAADKVKSFDVLLSTDGGASFSTNIASGLPSNQVSLTWIVPDTCASNARLELIATTASGERVTDVSDESFAIRQNGPGLDLAKSSIGSEGLALSTASGDVFQNDAVVEISIDDAGTSFDGFSRSAKVKSHGRKLKTRGTINGRNTTEFFPDGASRVLRVSMSPCNVTRIKVQRSGAQLLQID
jgi:hypothetical protein